MYLNLLRRLTYINQTKVKSNIVSKLKKNYLEIVFI